MRHQKTHKADLPHDCIPASADEVVFEIHRGPDSQNRYSFTMYWQTDYIAGHPDPQPVMTRGQCFFGDVHDYTEKYGDKARIVDRRPRKGATHGI